MLSRERCENLPPGPFWLIAPPRDDAENMASLAVPCVGLLVEPEQGRGKLSWVVRHDNRTRIMQAETFSADRG